MVSITKFINYLSRRRTLLAYLIPLVCAIGVRALVFTVWLGTPFRYYHLIPGLDMQTHMNYAHLFCQGGINFSLYRFVMAIILLLAGSDAKASVGIVLFHCFCGICICLLTVFIALYLTRSRFAACIAGIFAALYSSELVYECFVLREPFFALTCVLALAASVGVRIRANILHLLVCGMIIALPAATHFYGIIWTLCCLCWIVFRIFKGMSRPAVGGGRSKVRLTPALALGTASVFAAASVYNVCNRQSPLPFPAIPDFKYIAKAGSEQNLKTLSVPESAKDGGESARKGTSSAMNYAEKFLMLFHHYEIPDNVNVYFVRNFLWPLKLSLTPGIVLPLAVAGILILLIQQKLLSRYLVLFAYLAALGLPLVVYVPLARYRLALMPVFCILAAYPAAYLYGRLRLPSKGAVVLLAYFAAGMLFCYFSTKIPGESYYRGEDFVAYGAALEICAPGEKEMIRNAYEAGLMLDGDSVSAAIHLTNFMKANAEFKEAEPILKHFFLLHPNNYVIATSYASCLVALLRPDEAEKILLSLGEPGAPQSKMRFLYWLGECKRLQGKAKEATELFSKALGYAATPDQRKIIEDALANSAASD